MVSREPAECALAPISPASAAGVTTYGDEYSEGVVWRHGDILVMMKGARLPLRCARSNEPVEELVERKLTWCPREWFLLFLMNFAVGAAVVTGMLVPYPRAWMVHLLVNLLVCIIILRVRNKATIMIGLSKETIRRRRTALAVGWLGPLAGILLFLIGVGTRWDVLGLLGLLVFPVTLIYACFWSRTVSASRIDDHYVHLGGCCHAYLDAFPPLPTQPTVS